jgi:pimeloyl-ACP methyl ester carboxylesterase
VTTRRAVVGARAIHVRAAGEAHAGREPTIVLLHGWVIAGEYLERAASRLGASRHVLVPDLPGMGQSDRPWRPATVGDLAEGVLAWLDAEGIERVVLAGHSFGAQVAVKIAMRQPDRIARLVLVSPTVDAARRTVRSQSARLALEALLDRSPRLVAWWLRDLGRHGLERAARTLRQAIGDRPEDSLPFIHVPTLVVRGALDPLVSRRWAREVATLLPDAEYAEVPGATHALPYAAADRFAELLLRFAAVNPPADLLGARPSPPPRP